MHNTKLQQERSQWKFNRSCSAFLRSPTMVLCLVVASQLLIGTSLYETVFAPSLESASARPHDVESPKSSPISPKRVPAKQSQERQPSALPTLPWPPPKWTAHRSVSWSEAFPTKVKTVDDARQHLDAQFANETPPSEFLVADDGFALLTQRRKREVFPNGGILSHNFAHSIVIAVTAHPFTGDETLPASSRSVTLTLPDTTRTPSQAKRVHIFLYEYQYKDAGASSVWSLLPTPQRSLTSYIKEEGLIVMLNCLGNKPYVAVNASG